MAVINKCYGCQPHLILNSIRQRVKGSAKFLSLIYCLSTFDHVTINNRLIFIITQEISSSSSHASQNEKFCCESHEIE